MLADDVESQGQQQGQGQAAERQGLYTGNHKKTAIAHVIFKIFAVLFYIIGKWAWEDRISTFIVVILFSAADFWVTKNVTGRVLVALRWWNRIREDGTTEWMFEAAPDRSGVSSCDSTFFWSALFGSVGVWILMIVVAIFSVDWTWLPVLFVALTLSAVNAYGYAKCKKDWKKAGAQYVAQKAAENPEMAVEVARQAATSGARPAAGSVPPQTLT